MKIKIEITEWVKAMLISIGFPIFMFLIWLILGYAFNDVKMGIFTGIVFALFYGLRILSAWLK